MKSNDIKALSELRVSQSPYQGAIGCHQHPSGGIRGAGAGVHQDAVLHGRYASDRYQVVIRRLTGECQGAGTRPKLDAVLHDRYASGAMVRVA